MPNTITGKRIFVTGGAGFIGSYVVGLLLEQNPEKVFILDNFARGNRNNMSGFIDDKRVEFTEGNIRDHLTLERIISRSDYVFHMAALRINACAADPAEGFEVMLRSTFNLANLCVKHKIKKVIYSSSASVYGLATHFPTPETDPPYHNQTFYGAAKMWGEQLFRSYKFMYGLDYVALRYFNVYGARMDTDGKYTEVMIKWLDCIRDGRNPVIFGDGTDTMDFIDVRDVAVANILALQADATDEAFNIGTCRETSLKQLLDLLLAANHSSLSPQFAGSNAVNPVKRRLADIDKANRLLGFNPAISLEEGLKQLSAWYFQKQNITRSS